MTLFNLQSILPEITVLSGLVLLLLIDAFVVSKHKTIVFYLAQAIIVVAAILTACQFNKPAALTFDGTFIVDRFAIIVKLFIYLTTAISFYFSRHHIAKYRIVSSEYYLLGLFAILGMMILVSSYHLITLYLGLELLSLAIYTMIAMYRVEMAIEAAMKFFIIGAIASGFLLYGMSMLYGATHSLAIATISRYSYHLSGIELATATFGLIFLIAGVAFKLGTIPFHTWVADVYQGAPLPVVLVVSSAVKIASFAMAIRLLVNMLPGMAHHWQLWLTVIAVLSMIGGNILAIAQDNFKRLLAYSSIAHMGYMLLGLLCATSIGYSAAMFYIISYALSALVAFSLLSVLSASGIEVNEINSLQGLNARCPWLAFMMLLIMFSLAGVPPLVGFLAKLTVITALIDMHHIGLASLSLIVAVIGVYYYIRVVKVMYFQAPRVTTSIAIRPNFMMVLTINSIILLLLGIFPSILLTLCHHLF